VLVSEFELGILWDEYGLVGDLVVCNHLIRPFIPPNSDASQPFTNDFPRADIHQLIAPDLLHQLIKGTFKDHLVSWVGKYIVNTHGQARANEILDDIDKRYD
jgi:Plavaka transposase